MNYILRWDDWVFFKINSRLRCVLLNKLMPVFTLIGGATFSITATLILLVFSGGFSGIGKEAVIALAGSHLIVQIGKRSVTRMRPHLVLPGVTIWAKFMLKDYSFPSGHTTASFSLATAASIHYPLVAPVLLTIAVFVGFSRIYLGQHYPTDVFVGSVIGIISAILACIY